LSGRVRVRLGAAALALLCAAQLGGCATIHRWTHRQPSPGCHEQPFTGTADTRSGLKVPEGLSAPDTTGAIKIPPVTAAEAPRGKNDPCLDMPPDYGPESTGAPPRRPPP
jgi:hypothetical protein